MTTPSKAGQNRPQAKFLWEEYDGEGFYSLSEADAYFESLETERDSAAMELEACTEALGQESRQLVEAMTELADTRRALEISVSRYFQYEGSTECVSEEVENLKTQARKERGQ